MKMGGMPAIGLSPSLGAMPPGTSQGMAEMAKEMSKVKGVPILQIMRVGSTLDGQPLPAASEAPLPASASTMPSAGDVAKDSATTAATSTAASKMGGFGGLVGGLGGLGHKKKKQEQPAESSNADAPATSVLMESSTELTTFSSAAIDASRFGIPVGYKQVQSESGVRSRDQGVPCNAALGMSTRSTRQRKRLSVRRAVAVWSARVDSVRRFA